jgi:ABC-type bacteriocin/lantibiotic exporter with double-glycine peptidase domain
MRRRTVAGILLASLALNLCGLATPRITQAILDRVLPTGDFALLTQYLLLLVLITVVHIALGIWLRLALIRFSLQIDRRALGDLCAHLLALPLPFFRRRRTGDLLARFHDHQHIRHLLAGGLTRVAIDAVMVVINKWCQPLMPPRGTQKS